MDAYEATAAPPGPLPYSEGGFASEHVIAEPSRLYPIIGVVAPVARTHPKLQSFYILTISCTLIHDTQCLYLTSNPSRLDYCNVNYIIQLELKCYILFA